ncbi:hypothetical protein D3C87_1600220 [compost metagenome]
MNADFSEIHFASELRKYAEERSSGIEAFCCRANIEMRIKIDDHRIALMNIQKTCAISVAIIMATAERDPRFIFFDQ